jgi:hypothetical protein
MSATSSSVSSLSTTNGLVSISATFCRDGPPGNHTKLATTVVWGYNIVIEVRLLSWETRADGTFYGVPFGRHYVLPAFVLEATGDDFDYDVVMRVSVGESSRPEVDSYELRRRIGGPKVSSGRVRNVPFELILRRGIGLATVVKLHRRDDPRVVGWGLATHAESEAANAVAESERRRWKLDDELLARVAEVYLSNPEAPRRAVEAAFNVTQRTASHWIRKARERGFLEPYGGQ